MPVSGTVESPFKTLVKRLGMRDVIVGALNYRARLQREALRRRWIAQTVRAEQIIHPTLEFRGAEMPYNWVTLGGRVCIERDVTIWIAPEAEATPRLTLADDAFIGRNSYIGVYEPIEIGAYVMIGAYSYLISANHRYDRRDIPIQKQGFVGAPICIEEKAWIGTHVVVLPGVTIGQGAIVAAGSLVNRSIPPYEIWGGMPAKFIKQRPE